MKNCKYEGCEMPHCCKCGRHYDLDCAEGQDVCDACQIQQYSDETEAIVKKFDGNYEEAAKWMGW